MRLNHTSLRRVLMCYYVCTYATPKAANRFHRRSNTRIVFVCIGWLVTYGWLVVDGPLCWSTKTHSMKWTHKRTNAEPSEKEREWSNGIRFGSPWNAIHARRPFSFAPLAKHKNLFAIKTKQSERINKHNEIVLVHCPCCLGFLVFGSECEAYAYRMYHHSENSIIARPKYSGDQRNVRTRNRATEFALCTVYSLCLCSSDMKIQLTPCVLCSTIGRVTVRTVWCMCCVAKLDLVASHWNDIMCASLNDLLSPNLKTNIYFLCGRMCS